MGERHERPEEAAGRGGSGTRHARRASGPAGVHRAAGPGGRARRRARRHRPRRCDAGADGRRRCCRWSSGGGRARSCAGRSWTASWRRRSPSYARPERTRPDRRTLDCGSKAGSAASPGLLAAADDTVAEPASVATIRSALGDATLVEIVEHGGGYTAVVVRALALPAGRARHGRPTSRRRSPSCTSRYGVWRGWRRRRPSSLRRERPPTTHWRGWPPDWSSRSASTASDSSSWCRRPRSTRCRGHRCRVSPAARTSPSHRRRHGGSTPPPRPAIHRWRPE